MQSLLTRDLKKRLLVKKYEKEVLFFKSIKTKMKLNDNIKWQQNFNLSNIPKNASKIRINKRCLITGRSKANINFFKISRIKLKKLSLDGFLPGVRKASW